MKKLVLFCLWLPLSFLLHAQELDKTEARLLVSKNLAGLGFSENAFNNLVVSNAFRNELAGTDMVYLQQSYKSLPILNQLIVLAFKNGVPVSQAGKFSNYFESASGIISEVPGVAAESAVKKALSNKNLVPTQGLKEVSIAPNKKDFGKVGIMIENITAQLMWVFNLEDQKMHLVWQVYLVPLKSSDYFLIQVDAHTNNIIGEHNLTVYCTWNHPGKPVDARHTHTETENTNPDLHGNPVHTAAIGATGKQNSLLSPSLINGASYRVIPFPAESPLHAGGAHSLVTNPWSAATNNATTLKWHSDGTTDYNYTRGNNVWAYHDRFRTNSPAASNSATSTTSTDPLTFDFTPNFQQIPTQTAPVPNQQFNTTNLFYWNNIIHDVMYQYGFDEVAGNFQASNQGRGGAGNDYVRAEAQDGGGLNNANFSTPVDGQSGRMQMYLWNGPSRGINVNSPAAIAGNYIAVQSAFSNANLLSLLGPVSGEVVYYNDDASGTTHDACAAPANTIAGKIALITRGNCDFVVKAVNAQTAGAIGIIVINNVAGAPLIMGGGPNNSITIPAVMISQSDGAILAAQIGNSINVTLNPPLDFDGDVDNGIVVHEFAHGISNRLTAGPSQVTCIQNAEHMGEGWSDYYSLMLTQNWAASNINTGASSPRGIGTYAAGEATTGLGIRTKRYSTDFSVNDLVYTASLPGTNLQHTRGELWCATLWDMTWNIIQQVNSITPSIYNAAGTGGNVIALKLVTEGMKLQPCSPGFIDGRDAILRADELLYGGQYSCAIREAFRRRGMGAFASQGSSQSVTDQVPDFSPFLSTSLTQNVTQVQEGQNIIYTSRITSCGPISNYLLTDTLPSNVTYVSGGSYNAGTRVVSFPVNLTSAGSQNYSFTVSVNNGSYYSPTTYLNDAITASSIPGNFAQSSTTAAVWALSTAASQSPTNSLFTPNTESVSNQVLTSATAITLGANQSSLSFWHNYNTERDFDGGVLEISTNNGTSWTDLNNRITLGYYNSIIDASAGTPIAGKQAFSGNSGGFLKTSVDLTSFAGQNALLRWNFHSDNGTAGVGWYVDDILVKNEAVVNMRSSLLSASGTRVKYSDTVTVILETVACNNAAIVTQPMNTTTCVGSNAGMSVTATGTSLSYQWQVSTDAGASFNNIVGATAATLALNAVTAGMNNNRYRVIVSNNCPSTITSAAAILTVTNPSVISQQPVNATVCSGNNAVFSVTATGPALTYQWQVSTNAGSTWTNITAATAATLTLTGVLSTMNGNQYRVIISSCTPGGLTSVAATLTVNGGVTITTQPASVSICSGSNTNFSVTATGTALSYQWQISTNGGTTFTAISGANTATLSLNAVTVSMNAHQYRAIVSNACPSSVTSAVAILSVGEVTVISTQPASTTVCSGSNATFGVTATGSNPISQWQVSTDGGAMWNNISGATSTTLTLNAVTASLNNNRYRVVLSSCAGASVTSSTATLTVQSAPTITTQPTSTTACTGGNITFTIAATGTSLSYQWQVSTNGGSTWTNISAATSTSLALTSVTAGMNANQYRVVVSGTCVPATVNSAAAVLTINNSVIISEQPVSTAVCAGTNVTFTTNASGSGLTYQWQVSNNGGTSFSNINGATSNTLSLNAVTPSMNANQYRAVLNGDCVSNLNSASATLTVNSSVSIVTQPANQVGCAPNAAVFSVTATGTTITYQWQMSVNGGNTWTNVTGANSSTLTVASLTPALSGNQYRVVVAGVPCGTLTSSAASLTVATLPVVTITASPAAIYPSVTSTLTATVNPTGTYSFQWFKNNIPVPGASSGTLVVNIDELGTYRVIANNSNGCSNTSGNLTVSDTLSNRIFIYPNPNNGQFQVRYYSSATNPARIINVFDSKGAKVYSKTYTFVTPYDKMDVNLGNVSGGVYYVELLDASGKRIAGGTVFKY